MARPQKQEAKQVVRQPLGSIDEVLAKHPGNWKACIDELRVIERAIVERGGQARMMLDLCREQLMKCQAQIALLERLSTK